MKHADKVKIRRALKIVKEAAGAISTIRALASQGVPGDVAGRWIAEGQRLLRDWLPDHRRCRAAGCGFLSPRYELRPLEPGDGYHVARASRKTAEGPCPSCGGVEFETPTTEQELLLKLARCDDRTEELLARKAGKRLAAILDKDDEKYAGAQSRLIPWILAIVNPTKFGQREEAEAPAVEGAAPAWARQLRPEDLDRLPEWVLDRLGEIAEQHAALEAEAQGLVADALGGVIEVAAIEGAKKDPCG